MNTKVTRWIGTWAFLIGLVLALGTVFFDLGSWVTQVLIVLGILVGVFHRFTDKLIPLGVTYLVLAAAASSMSDLLLVGSFITDIATAWVRFLGPVVLTAFLF
ncbi:MAG: hypothetical protein ACK2T7_06445, partial [Anaerolineales bacterium]